MRIRPGVLALGGIVALALPMAPAVQAAPESLVYPVAGSTGKLSPDQLTPRRGKPSSTLSTDVKYAQGWVGGADWDGDPLKADLRVDFDRLATVPAAGYRRPAIVLFHGGLIDTPACVGSRRAAMIPVRDQLVDAGYIVFDAEFRLAPSTADDGNVLPCSPNAGWEAYNRAAEISAQLAVRSLKYQLRRFATASPADPLVSQEVRARFAAASTRIVAMGTSYGGHLAARLALRSENRSADPADAGRAESASFRSERRISGAVGLSSVGECTASNRITDWSKVGSTTITSPPWAGCSSGPIEADDAPTRLYNAVLATNDERYLGTLAKFPITPSPLSGQAGWGSNAGYDGVIDQRWPTSTCADLAAGGVSCRAFGIKVDVSSTASFLTAAHQRFPDPASGFRALQRGADPLTWNVIWAGRGSTSSQSAVDGLASFLANDGGLLKAWP